MHKSIMCFVFTLLITNYIFPNSYDINDANFIGININKSEYKNNNTEFKYKYNTAFSAILPSDGVYIIADDVTGREAIIQIGYVQVDGNPYNLYLPEYLFDFFASKYDEKIDRIQLHIKFMAWNKEGEEANNLDIYSLIVKPEQSMSEILKNGMNNYYIQLGAFSFYQNSYPIIIDLLPSLKVNPKFYMVKKLSDKSEMYRVLAGPYSKEKAKEIITNINKSHNKKVFMNSTESILEEFMKSKNKGK